MQSIAAYYVMISYDLARQNTPRYQVEVARPSRVKRLATALAGLVRPTGRTSSQPA